MTPLLIQTTPQTIPEEAFYQLTGPAILHWLKPMRITLPRRRARLTSAACPSRC
ncbi:hypothetical protein SAMN05421538_102237 [Paracoccus isoporae]|uniref:Uncharacterized protein n=1 Tax=Paracoccus isoporae TaxID=591205 RepID=A0A1G6WXZ2_9RHOB|nr:hypothetical protein [Paracoccus isoporae]SDD70057.1 hypothetical protein SAMN05421538_102237 [Paracoccus isoporae]